MRTSSGSIRVMKISQKISDPPGIAEIDDGEGGEGGDEDLAQGDAGGEDEAVQQLPAEIDAAPGFRQILDEMAPRNQRHGHQIDRAQIVARRR